MKMNFWKLRLGTISQWHGLLPIHHRRWAQAKHDYEKIVFTRTVVVFTLIRDQSVFAAKTVC